MKGALRVLLFGIEGFFLPPFTCFQVLTGALPFNLYWLYGCPVKSGLLIDAISILVYPPLDSFVLRGSVSGGGS